MCYPCDRGIVLPICPGYTNHSPGIHPGFKSSRCATQTPFRVRFRAWARNRTRMSEEGRLAGRFPRDESRGYDCFGWPAPDVGVRSDKRLTIAVTPFAHIYVAHPFAPSPLFQPLLDSPLYNQSMGSGPTTALTRTGQYYKSQEKKSRQNWY